MVSKGQMFLFLLLPLVEIHQPQALIFLSRRDYQKIGLIRSCRISIRHPFLKNRTCITCIISLYVIKGLRHSPCHCEKMRSNPDLKSGLRPWQLTPKWQKGQQHHPLHIPMLLLPHTPLRHIRVA